MTWRFENPGIAKVAQVWSFCVIMMKNPNWNWAIHRYQHPLSPTLVPSFSRRWTTEDGRELKSRCCAGATSIYHLFSTGHSFFLHGQSKWDEMIRIKPFLIPATKAAKAPVDLLLIIHDIYYMRSQACEEAPKLISPWCMVKLPITPPIGHIWQENGIFIYLFWQWLSWCYKICTLPRPT